VWELLSVQFSLVPVVLIVAGAALLLSVMRRQSAQAVTQSKPRRWSQRVTEKSNALDLDPGVFTLGDPRAIARSLKRSAERSHRRKTTPYQSAMSMLTFYINRAGRQLTKAQRTRLERAKDELRAVFGKVR